MTEQEKRIIGNVIKRLEGEKGASDAIKAMLADTSMRCWLGSWVIPPLRILIDSERTRDDMKTAEGLSR